MTAVDPHALAARLTEIADDPRWSVIYRMEAQAGVDGWHGQPPLDPQSLSDDHIGEALRARILDRGQRRDPDAKPMDRDAMLTWYARMVVDAAEGKGGHLASDTGDNPTVETLRNLLVAVDGGTRLGPRDRVADGWAHARGLVFGGVLTDRGRRVLDILGGAS